MNTHHHNRGVATVIVMIAVATVAIIAWAMLSASQLSSQISANTASSRQAFYSAESGVSLGIYYLRYPDKAPFLGKDKWGYSYYPGETGIDVSKDGHKVDIVVTPLGNDKYRVTSATSESGTGSVSNSSVVVEVTRLNNVIDHGLMANGKIELPSNVVINGTVQAVGEIVAGVGQLLGAVFNVGKSGGGSDKTEIVPKKEDLTLYQETKIRPSGASFSQRAYTYRGKTYWADAVPKYVSGTLKADVTTNPCNVWYTDHDVTFDNVTLNGTIIARDEDLRVTGNTNISAMPGMPAVICKNLDLASGLFSPTRLTVNGVVWVGDKVKNSGKENIFAKTLINGALLMAENSPKIEDKVRGVFQINYDRQLAVVESIGTNSYVTKVQTSNWQSN